MNRGSYDTLAAPQTISLRHGPLAYCKTSTALWGAALLSRYVVRHAGGRQCSCLYRREPSTAAIFNLAVDRSLTQPTPFQNGEFNAAASDRERSRTTGLFFRTRLHFAPVLSCAGLHLLWSVAVWRHKGRPRPNGLSASAACAPFVAFRQHLKIFCDFCTAAIAISTCGLQFNCLQAVRPALCPKGDSEPARMS